MTVALWILGAWSVVAALAWLALYLHSLRVLAVLPRLRDAPAGTLDPWPRLSILIPACNEAGTIEAAMTTILAQDYPDLEVVLVNDRSTDDTGAIVDRIAAGDPRIRPVHITTLPDGWLGKVHALHKATQHATGDFFLFMDADVHLVPGLLRKAVAAAQDRHVDLFAVAPHSEVPSFAYEVAFAAFGAMFLASVRPERLSVPGSDAYVGIGAFNLVRRSVFERSEGFEWLRLEVADDVGLGLVMQRAGAKIELWLGRGEVSLTWYEGLGGMVRGLEKNLFGVLAHYRLWLLLVRLTGIWLLLSGPFVGVCASPWFGLSALVAVAVMLLQARVAAREGIARFSAAALSPLGYVALTYIALRSAWVCLRRGAIVWRGTSYPLRELRAMQRVKL